MTGTTRWNKTTTPAGADGWNLTTDTGKALDTANVIVPVANGTERDGLTPPGGKYPGMAAARADVPGQALELYDGTAWARVGPTVIPAGSHVGSTLTATAFTTGTSAPIFQGGSVVVTTDASGYFSINYPTPFPHGVLCVLFMNGDSAAAGRDKIVSGAGSPFTNTTSVCFGGVIKADGTVYASTTIRVEFLALGW